MHGGPPATPGSAVRTRLSPLSRPIADAVRETPVSESRSPGFVHHSVTRKMIMMTMMIPDLDEEVRLPVSY